MTENRLLKAWGQSLACSLALRFIITQELKMEQASHTNRGKFAWLVIDITCGFFALLAVCILAITVVIHFIEENGF